MGVPQAPQKANPALTTAPHAGHVEPSADDAETAGFGFGSAFGSGSGFGVGGSDAALYSVAAEAGLDFIA
jgi:hypothetical protein